MRSALKDMKGKDRKKLTGVPHSTDENFARHQKVNSKNSLLIVRIMHDRSFAKALNEIN